MAANDKHLFKDKCISFYKVPLNTDDSPLKTYVNSILSYPNFIFSDVELSNDLSYFWESVGPFMKNLTIRNCDIHEKVFDDIIEKCSNLEGLTIENCKDLFMSGCLLDAKSGKAIRDSFKDLKLLNLSNNQYLTDALLYRFLTAATELREINLSLCPIQFHLGLVKKFYPTEITYNPSESVLTFYFISHILILNGKTVKHLSFSNTLIDGLALKALSEIEGLELESLHVHSCDQLTNTGILALCTHQTTLKELHIGLCTRVTDQSLVHICTNLVNLEFLNIQRCRAVTDLGVAELSKLKKLKSLNISQCELITKEGLEKGLCTEVNNTLIELDVHSLNLDEAALIMLSEKLPKLEYLDISYCFHAVTDVSIQIILKNQNKLHTLKMSHCDKVSDVGLTGMAKAENENECKGATVNIRESSHPRIPLGSKAEEEIVRDAQRKHNVMKLCETITTNTCSGYSMECLKGLKILDLSGCNRITDVSMIYAFKFNELLNLNLSRCQQITNKGMEVLVKNCPSIEYLNLTDCYNLKDDAITAIVKGLRRLKNLELRVSITCHIKGHN